MTQARLAARLSCIRGGRPSPPAVSSSQAAKSIKGLLSVVPGLFLFGLPSVATLLINYELAWLPFVTDGGASGLRVAWLLEAIAMVAAGAMPLAAGSYGSSQAPRTEDVGAYPEAPSATLEIVADLGGHHATGTAVLRRAAEPQS